MHRNAVRRRTACGDLLFREFFADHTDKAVASVLWRPSFCPSVNDRALRLQGCINTKLHAVLAVAVNNLDIF